MTGRQVILDQATGRELTAAQLAERYERQRVHFHAVRERTRAKRIDQRGGTISTDLLRVWITRDASQVAADELARRHPARSSAANLAAAGVTGVTGGGRP